MEVEVEVEVGSLACDMGIGVEAKGREGCGVAESKGEGTSFATFRMADMPRSRRDCQSRALSSEPSHMRGRTCMGPLA